MEKWEERFDNQFGLYSNYNDFCPDKEAYKDFIRETLAEQISKAKEEGRVALLVELYNVDPNNRSAAIVQRVSELLLSSLSDTPNEKN